MNLKEIEALLEKFYEGATSLEEEQRLKEYFNEGNVPENLAEIQEQFVFYRQAREEMNPKIDVEQRLSEKIDKEKNSGSQRKKQRIYYFVTGVAASILIFIGVYFQFIASNNSNTFAMEDTYQDPEEAYTEAKKALLLVSEKFNAGVQDFNKFSSFNQYKELITRKN